MYKIENLDHYGRGITKINDKITFVENALPGEIVDLKIKCEKKKYIEATIINYIQTSKERIETKCPYYNLCGGCNIMHMSYEEQLKFKYEKIKNIINKYLKKDIKINDIVKSNNIFNYRNKVTFQVKENIGFYKNETYDLINIDNCLISHKLINNSIKYLKKLNLKDIKKIVCRVGNNKLMLILETNNNNININCLKKIANSIYLKFNNKYIHVFGDEYIYEFIDNYKYIISPDSFFQVNIDVCTKLYKKIKEYVGINKNVLDLYCGTGTIGIFVSNKNNVLGIEINEYAIKDANENKKLNKINNIDFICGDSGKKTKEISFKPDIIIIDPPRSGLNKETINNILEFDANTIIYVSCDPMTLSRDLTILYYKYEIKEITPYDMFPNTYHVESLVLLNKKM